MLYSLRDHSPTFYTISICSLSPFFDRHFLFFFFLKNCTLIKQRLNTEQQTYNQLSGLSWERISFFRSTDIVMFVVVKLIFFFPFSCNTNQFFLIQYYLTYEYVYSSSHKIDHLLNFIAWCHSLILYSISLKIRWLPVTIPVVLINTFLEKRRVNYVLTSE